jgi:hypothetical protein
MFSNLMTQFGEIFKLKPQPSCIPYSTFIQLKQICENEENEAIKNRTCSLIKKIENDYRQPTRWTLLKGTHMLSYETTIHGPNYMGGEEPDYLWKNEERLLEKWNMNIISHSVQYNEAGGGYSDYGGGPGVAWVWETHRFIFSLPENFFDGSLKYHGL